MLVYASSIYHFGKLFDLLTSKLHLLIPKCRKNNFLYKLRTFTEIVPMDYKEHQYEPILPTYILSLRYINVILINIPERWLGTNRIPLSESASFDLCSTYRCLELKPHLRKMAVR